MSMSAPSRSVAAALCRALAGVALLAAATSLAACKSEPPAKAEVRPVRVVAVDPKPIDDDRQTIGEVKPRHESDLSFRVAGKILSRLVDVGATVKRGDTLATLDTQDYQNRLRAAEADVSSAEAALVEAQGAESRSGKLLKDGYTPKANYDTALRNLRSAEAKVVSARANLDLTRDQLKYTELKADVDGVITAVGVEAGQNVNAGQMVMKLAQPNDKDAVFNIAETAFRDHKGEALPEVVVWPLSNPDLLLDGQAREVSPVADPTTRTYTVKVTLKTPPPQIRFGMSVGGRVKGSSAPVVVLPLLALYDKGGAPAVWVFSAAGEASGQGSVAGSVALKPVTVSRYETDSVVIADGLAKGDLVVTAGVNMLREGQKVRLAEGGPSAGTPVKAPQPEAKTLPEAKTPPDAKAAPDGRKPAGSAGK